MCRKLSFLMIFAVLLGMALTNPVNADDPNLVGHWKLDDEGTGIVSDSSGNNRSGTLMGGANLVPGLFGDAVEIATTGDRVEITDFPGVTGTQSRTVCAWIKTETTGEIVSWGENSAGQKWIFRVQTSDGNAGAIRVEVNGGYSVASTDVRDGQWHHVAAVLVDDGTPDANEIKLYLDGSQEVISDTESEPIDTASTGVVRIGEAPWHYRPFVGLIDEVRIYDRVLTQPELLELARPLTATNPEPPAGATNVAYPLLQWTRSDIAASHNVYFGTNPIPGPNDFKGQQTVNMYFYSAPFTPGTTYYWRIDVLEADGTTIHEGDIWSFTSVPLTANSPDPADDRRYVGPEKDLSWESGVGGIMHDVYFGTNQSDVATGTGDTFKGTQVFKTFEPGTLEKGTTYFWRIDEVGADGTTKHTGEVWSFKTRPVMPTTDPNLVAWWMFDDEGTGTVIDYSGNDHDGTFYGTATYAPGIDGDALMLRNDSEDCVTVPGYKGVLRISNDLQHAFTITAWVKTNGNGEIVGWGNNSGRQRVEFRLDGGRLRVEHGSGNKRGDTTLNDDQWHHVALVVPEGGDIESTIFYLDGAVDPQREISNPSNKFNLVSNFDVQIGRRYDTNDRLLYGLLDDVRIYDKALTQEEINYIMLRFDPMRTWNPNPVNGALLDVEHLPPLSWSAGDLAAEHDIYFGTDKDAVALADVSDTTGIYRGRQNLNNTSYTPTEALEWGTGPYYWKINEYNSDGTVSEGRVWSFTVADFILVDDFEAYDTEENQIWYAWKDGLGYGSPDMLPYYAGNGTGAAVGDDTTGSYTEESIVNTARQSMPFWYDNNKQGYAYYSETEMTLIEPRDWTKHDTELLSVRYRGYLESASAITGDPSGTFTMATRSGDIWGNTDQLYYLFKQLSGPGSISAKIDSVTNTSASAKVGVMIREMLTADSKHAFTFMRPDNGVRFNRRIEVGDVTTNSVENDLSFPQWVKLERDISGLFTASHSADGINWVPVNDESLGSSDTVLMGNNVYIGLALSSNNTAAICEAVISDIQVTGTVTGEWQSQEIAIQVNDPEPMYVALSNSTGDPAVVYHTDPAAAQIDVWTEWTIPLQLFADLGVDLTDVDSIAIGLGTQGNMTAPGGKGKMYIDDIRLYRARPEPEPQP
jgi:hypothetical protein